MDSFKHSVFLTDVCASCCTYAALELSCLISDDIAVKVRENDYLEVSAAFLVDELCCKDIYVPLVGCNFGILFADLFAKVKELTVRGLDNVCLCDN